MANLKKFIDSIKEAVNPKVNLLNFSNSQNLNSEDYMNSLTTNE